MLPLVYPSAEILCFAMYYYRRKSYSFLGGGALVILELGKVDGWPEAKMSERFNEYYI